MRDSTRGQARVVSGVHVKKRCAFDDHPVGYVVGQTVGHGGWRVQWDTGGETQWKLLKLSGLPPGITEVKSEEESKLPDVGYMNVDWARMVEIFDNSAISSVNGPPMTIRVSLGCYSRMEMQVAKREAKGVGSVLKWSQYLIRYWGMLTHEYRHLEGGVSRNIDHVAQCNLPISDKNYRGVEFPPPYLPPTHLPRSTMIVLINWRCLGRAAGTSPLYTTWLLIHSQATKT